MRLFGREWTRDEIERYVGDMSQIGGVTRSVLVEGPEAGVEVISFRTGTGLCFEVLPTRGMDIGSASFCGVPLAWRSGTGYVAPALYEAPGLGWLRSFAGGLLVTCGLTYMGAAGADRGTSLGLHGRAANTPASRVYADAAWQGDDYVMWARGQIREVSVFGEYLQLTRQVSTKLGTSEIVIDDTVENLAYAPQEHMLLYHMNLGYPLAGPDSRILAPTHSVMPRDEEAGRGAEQWPYFDLPTPGYAEKVYFHELSGDAGGYASVAVAAPQAMAGGLVLQLRYRVRELPYLIQWKMCGEGTYVLGLEPANALVMGRAAEREAGRLQVLGPREKRHYRLVVSVGRQR